MASMRDIKRRIKSVGSTQQITKAMNLVSASKLQKTKNNLAVTRPFFNETYRVIGSVINSSKGINHPFLRESDGKRVLIISISSDRGLCGGYNTNINKAVANFIDKKETTSLILIGSKARDYFKRRNKSILKSVVGISEKPTYEDAKKLGELVLDQFVKGEFDEVYIAYTEFISTLSHEPKIKRLLPVDASEFESESKNKDDLTIMAYEPEEEEVLSYIVPKYINTMIYGSMVESSTCEQAARMTSMDAATDNASSMIDSLGLLYNRTRQGAITQELTEIVSGANALK